MTAWAYYNEHDRFAAAWLRELMKDGLIAPGEVDERDLEDVTPDDIRSFRQVHLCAGIGVWSIAARLAGFADDEALWSGSFPCQPFSAAGKGEGFADERHLWPTGHYLIEQCGPPIVVGEQVTGADGDAWLDLVSIDLDATGYGFGAAETCAAGFGAPHERSRNYWVAHRIGAGLEGHAGHGDDRDQPRWIDARSDRSAAAGGVPDRLGDTVNEGGCAIARLLYGAGAKPAGRSSAERLADGFCQRRSAWRDDHGRHVGNQLDAGDRGGLSRINRPGPTNGFWRDVDWLGCRDDRFRPVEPGTFPLVDAGAFRNRVGLLRGAGNAVTLGQAAGFLIAVRQSLRLDA